MIAILAGGVGAAKFARGISQIEDPSEITIVSNVGDDEIMHGLHISPDIDTVIYTLADEINPETGWGLRNESWRVMDALGDYGGETWFRLGDRDLATHLFRTQLLRTGESLTKVTDRIRARWGVEIKILPATNDRLRTKIFAEIDGEEKELSFQEYFVGHAHQPSATRLIYENSGQALATSEVIHALENADEIIIAPSNPLLSIAPILSIPRISEIVENKKNKVAAISPIIAGNSVKGPAAKLMQELGFQPTAFGVAEFYANFISSIVIDTQDSSFGEQISNLGIQHRATNTLMTDTNASAELASQTLDLIRNQ